MSGTYAAHATAPCSFRYCHDRLMSSAIIPNQLSPFYEDSDTSGQSPAALFRSGCHQPVIFIDRQARKQYLAGSCMLLLEYRLPAFRVMMAPKKTDRSESFSLTIVLLINVVPISLFHVFRFFKTASNLLPKMYHTITHNSTYRA